MYVHMRLLVPANANALKSLIVQQPSHVPKMRAKVPSWSLRICDRHSLSAVGDSHHLHVLVECVQVDASHCDKIVELVARAIVVLGGHQSKTTNYYWAAGKGYVDNSPGFPQIIFFALKKKRPRHPR